jgi:hypothetical protein
MASAVQHRTVHPAGQAFRPPRPLRASLFAGALTELAGPDLVGNRAH